jgi:hypothetical protein
MRRQASRPTAPPLRCGTQSSSSMMTALIRRHRRGPDCPCRRTCICRIRPSGGTISRRGHDECVSEGGWAPRSPRRANALTTPFTASAPCPCPPRPHAVAAPRQPSQGRAASPIDSKGFGPRRLKWQASSRSPAPSARSFIAPTTLFAQGVGGAVNAGAAVRGAVVRGIPTPADLGASNPAYYRSVQKHSQAPKKLRHRH